MNPEALAGRATTAPLLAGDAGTAQTIQAMRDLVEEALRDPLVRQTAGTVVQRVRPFDELGEVRALYDWMRRTIRFTKDPERYETVSSPRWTLTHGFGDCDDQAVLMAALAGAIGYPARFVTLAANPYAAEEFTHVYAEVYVRGRWVPVDTARPHTRFGSAPPRYFRKRVWELSSRSYQDVAGLSGYYHLGAVDWGAIIKQITTGATQVISAVRTPKQYLSPTSAIPSPVYVPPPPSSGFDTNTLLLGAAVLGGAYLLATRKG